MDGVWVIFVKWDGNHTSPPIGPFQGPRAYTEAQECAKALRRNLRDAGRKWQGRVRLSYVASPGRALGWTSEPREIRDVGVTDSYSDEEEIEDMQCPRGVTLPQFRNGLAQYRERYGSLPTPEELVAFIAIEEQKERDSFVRVIFAGGAGRWTYQVKPGDPIQVGDFLKVHSPRTDQAELVKVVELGRGPWVGPAKYASRIEWRVTD
jgi:hypothetical protein